MRLNKHFRCTLFLKSLEQHHLHGTRAPSGFPLATKKGRASPDRYR